MMSPGWYFSRSGHQTLAEPSHRLGLGLDLDFKAGDRVRAPAGVANVGILRNGQTDRRQTAIAVSQISPKMSATLTPKQLKSIIKAKVKSTKRVRVSEDTHAKAGPTLKPPSKSKGKQPEGAASAKTHPSPKPKEDQTRPNIGHSISPPPTAFKLVTGSYEKLLYGLEGSITPGEGDGDRISVTLKPIFIFPAHVSCVKAISGSPMGGKWLATGSADEIVKVWDLRRRKEVGGLMQHEGEFLIILCVPPR